MRPERRCTQIHPREPSSPAMTNRDDGRDQTFLSNNSSSTLFFSTDVTVGAQHRCWQKQMVPRGSALFPAPWAGLCKMGKRACVCRGVGQGCVFQQQVKSICHTSSNWVFSTEVNIWNQWGILSHRCGEAGGSLSLTVSSERREGQKKGRGWWVREAEGGLAREGGRWKRGLGLKWLERLCFLIFL